MKKNIFLTQLTTREPNNSNCIFSFQDYTIEIEDSHLLIKPSSDLPLFLKVEAEITNENENRYDLKIGDTSAILFKNKDGFKLTIKERFPIDLHFKYNIS